MQFALACIGVCMDVYVCVRVECVAHKRYYMTTFAPCPGDTGAVRFLRHCGSAHIDVYVYFQISLSQKIKLMSQPPSARSAR